MVSLAADREVGLKTDAGHRNERFARTGIRAIVLYGCATEPGSGLGLAVTITGVGRQVPAGAERGRDALCRAAALAPVRVRRLMRGPAGTRALPPGSAPGFLPSDGCRRRRNRPCAADPAAARGVPLLSGLRPRSVGKPEARICLLLKLENDYSTDLSRNPRVLAFSMSVRTFARSRPEGTSASISRRNFTEHPGRVVSCSTMASTI